MKTLMTWLSIVESSAYLHCESLLILGNYNRNDDNENMIIE